ncbi:phytochelatin synthase family protein [Celeribacter sp. PS-C1]|uniref:phytochelatin synthase family protein n=1 Tax=Celeribacter sp. PS-C1 TaxID=2820813 RepID=UPI001CA4C981|nr:phytochelatin synthase family protein [Celeribacter sp. PS-C1]MBW6417114.1 phytochelatin synthase family protein [Celeribacter sp. PS-C1]
MKSTVVYIGARALSLVLPLSLCASLAAHAEDEAPLPKLGPNATPVTEATDYLRSAPAPDFWAFAPYVKPQFTTSACGVASVTAAVNGLAGLPANAEDTVMTQPDLLEAVGDAHWSEISAEGGDGVMFNDLVTYAAAALSVAGLEDYGVTSFKPEDATEATLETIRNWLSLNEESSSDTLLVYFNQGVVTGDWDGPHVSLIGAYDAAKDEVLILEVDQEWYIPYWTPTAVLLEAMLKPTSDEHGVLEGQTGGFVRLAPAG